MKKPKATRSRKAVQVSPEEYAKFIAGLQLIQIRLREADCRLVVEDFDLQRGVEIATSDEVESGKGEEGAHKLIHTYTLSAEYKDSSETLVRIRCVFELFFNFEVPMSDAIFRVFAKNSLPVFSWPYFREFVHSAVGRMGLPPLVLPAIKRG